MGEASNEKKTSVYYITPNPINYTASSCAGVLIYQLNCKHSQQSTKTTAMTYSPSSHFEAHIDCYPATSCGCPEASCPSRRSSNSDGSRRRPPRSCRGDGSARRRRSTGSPSTSNRRCCCGCSSCRRRRNRRRSTTSSSQTALSRGEDWNYCRPVTGRRRDRRCSTPPGRFLDRCDGSLFDGFETKPSPADQEEYTSCSCWKCFKYKNNVNNVFCSYISFGNTKCCF